MLKSRLYKVSEEGEGLTHEKLKANITSVIRGIPTEKYENIFKGAYNRDVVYVKNKTRKRKLKNYKVQKIGVLNVQRCNAPYETCHTDYLGKGIDQLANIITALKDPEQRSSRRLVMSAWNPCQLDKMALPPCHILAQFNVRDGKYLSCSLYQRSGDVGLGVPFNIASYSFLTHILAKHCDLIAEEFVYCLGNAHIYNDHIEPLKEQLTREPYEFPKIRIRSVKEHIEDYTIDDLEWDTPYLHHPTIKMKMIV